MRKIKQSRSPITMHHISLNRNPALLVNVPNNLIHYTPKGQLGPSNPVELQPLRCQSDRSYRKEENVKRKQCEAEKSLLRNLAFYFSLSGQESKRAKRMLFHFQGCHCQEVQTRPRSQTSRGNHWTLLFQLFFFPSDQCGNMS